MSSRPLYRPELDVLRFFAFFFVFLHHVLPREPRDLAAIAPAWRASVASVTNAFGFGMTLFFLLSAFLITRLLLAEQERTGGLRIGDFYARRVLRIWPLYVVGLGIGLALVDPSDGADQMQMFAWFAGFAGNWFFLDHGWNGNPMAPLWSISVEEQFYLVLPVVLTMVGRDRAVGLGVGAMVLSAASLWHQGDRHLAIDTAIWVNTATHGLAFGAGIVLASVSFGRRFVAGAGLRVGLALTGLAALFVAAHVFEGKRMAEATSGASVVLGHATAVLGCVALVAAVLDTPRALPRPLVILGRISFGLYVFHLLAIRVAGHMAPPGSVAAAILALALTIAVAAVSYWGFERWFLRLREAFVRVEGRPI
ncbi:acyltransferase [Siculibacillus lacustris]|uniref:Acyltransferase n=1 Tax=Siculibacillus lacustris TaxID=1549641 RepID=A0A4Q9VMN1_9HYPH|nr:acyltransferase [Siculibacillus lacustris]TBW35934.1 acyltransferase [Siculibacillus lacustris]